MTQVLFDYTRQDARGVSCTAQAWARDHRGLRAALIGLVAAHRGAVPAAFAATVTLAAHQRAADYTIAAHVIEGLDVLPEIIVGEPAATPSRITRAYVVQRPR